jgi:beta-lactamase class A
MRCRAGLIALALLGAAGPARTADWTDALREEVERIEKDTPGRLGVYVERLGDGKRLEHDAGRLWYLASAVKLPIAIAVLQEMEAGRHSLDDKVVLEATDKIDGSGALVWQDDGATHSLGSLLERMLMQSDNTAANLLIRAIGEDTLNRRAREFLGAEGFRRITDFTQVRRDVYAELHPAARRLTNLQLVQVAAAPLGPQRVTALRRVLSLEQDELKVATTQAAYASYYAKQLNAATLTAYGGMLERLVRGKLLSPSHTRLLFTRMKFDTYDAYRLEAGLPETVRFIHKTGTQWRTACHMGVIEPQDGGRKAIVVAVCAEDLDESGEAGRAFERVGAAITRVLLNGNAAR